MSNRYIFFFDHVVSPANPFEIACLSNWFESRPFHDKERYPGKTFATAEHYFMYAKAQLFDTESDISERILAADTPAEAKRLGREIKGFDRARWDEHNEGIAERMSYLRFARWDDMKKALLGTVGKDLIETNPDDRIWGIGFDEKHALANQADWGQNKMGRALQRARDTLAKDVTSAS